MRYVLKKLGAGLENASTVFWAQALRTHQQHTLQSFKNMLLSRNLEQNMPKIALFFEKKTKNRRSVGGSTLKPPLAPRPPRCYPHHQL